MIPITGRPQSDELVTEGFAHIFDPPAHLVEISKPALEQIRIGENCCG
jgi:hypothetical protein